jgi:hypothetical protein
MTMQRAAPGLSKPLAILLVTIAAAAAAPGLASLSPWRAAEAPLAEALITLETAESGQNSKFVTATTLPLKVSDRRVYGNVGTQVLGTVPAAPNGKTGQIAMFVLLFTFLSAVTLLLWRHSRRDDASPRRIGRRI